MIATYNEQCHSIIERYTNCRVLCVVESCRQCRHIFNIKYSIQYIFINNRNISCCQFTLKNINILILSLIHIPDYCLLQAGVKINFPEGPWVDFISELRRWWWLYKEVDFETEFRRS